MSRSHRFRRIAWLALAAAVIVARPTTAQRIVVSGRGPLETDTILQRIARTSPLSVITADTVIPPTDTIQGPVLIAGTTIKLEGVLRGDVVIVDANVFLRPHSRITGRVINVGGGLFRADQATIDGPVTDYRDASYRAALDGGVLRIRGSQAGSLLDTHGVAGIRLPTYDRVNSLTLNLGATVLLPRLGRLEPELVARASWATARQRPGGLLETGIRSGTTRVALGVERAAVTNESWIRSDAVNSASFLVAGQDRRNYHEIDRTWVSLTRAWGPAESTVRATLGVQGERSRSLAARDPWTLRSPDSTRSNPPIDTGRVTSAWASVVAQWERPGLIARADAVLEAAARVAGGAREFGRFDLGGSAAMRALADHTLQVEWRFRGPLPETDSLPRQRWSGVGGRGTLYHLEALELRGDRLVYVETEYSIPLPPAATVGVLGRPVIELIHHAGKAWTRGHPVDLEHTLGLRLRFRYAWIMGIVDPVDTNDTDLLVGLTLPRRYPWWPRD